MGARKVSKYLVVGDADSIIAQASPKDLKHNEAASISKRLVSIDAQLVYPSTAIVEAVTFIQRVLNSGATAYGTAIEFVQSQNQIIEVDREVFSHAVNKYYGPRISKKDTLFDCIVASVADKHQADAIFSFDKFYKKHGFKLASEL